MTPEYAEALLLAVATTTVKAYAKGGALAFEGPLSDFPPSIPARAAAYAIHKKAQDASGGSDLTGSAATAAAREVIATLKAGTWAQKGGGGPRTILNYDLWIAKQAETWAETATKKKGGKHFGKDAKKLAEAAAGNEAWRALQQKDWEAYESRANKKAAEEVDLGI